MVSLCSYPKRCCYLSVHLKRTAGFIPSYSDWLICLNKPCIIPITDTKWRQLGQINASYFDHPDAGKHHHCRSKRFELLIERCGGHLQGVFLSFPVISALSGIGLSSQSDKSSAFTNTHMEPSQRGLVLGLLFMNEEAWPGCSGHTPSPFAAF